MLTYMVLDNYQEEVYRKQIDQYKEQVQTLQIERHTLKTELTRVNTVIEEEFDKETGKLIRRKAKKQSESQKNKEQTAKTIKETIVAEVRKEYEEQIRKKSAPNHVFFGYGSYLDDRYYAGYLRKVWFLDIGVMASTDYRLTEYGVAALVGWRF
jgi:phosphoglycolate phosphatase-like HAD superfamily hydrolase